MNKLWYLAPVVLPFPVLGFLRVFWFVAGATWTDPAVAAVFALTFGVAAGCFIIDTKQKAAAE